MSRSHPPRGPGKGDEERPPTETTPQGPAETVAVLQALLSSASALLDDLASNEAAERLRRIFARMPEGDRETILQVLEREVEYRCFTRGTGDLATGYETRPNPNARLYLRILTDPQPPPLMDHDELVVANHRGLRVLRYVLGPVHDVWHAAMTDAVALLAPEERAAARKILAEGLAILDGDESGSRSP